MRTMAMTGGMDMKMQKMVNGPMSTRSTMMNLEKEMEPLGKNPKLPEPLLEPLPAMPSSRRSSTRARAKAAKMGASIVEASGIR